MASRKAGNTSEGNSGKSGLTTFSFKVMLLAASVFLGRPVRFGTCPADRRSADRSWHTWRTSDFKSHWATHRTRVHSRSHDASFKESRQGPIRSASLVHLTRKANVATLPATRNSLHKSSKLATVFALILTMAQSSPGGTSCKHSAARPVRLATFRV